MPTVILLDTSLSMLRPIEMGTQSQEGTGECTRLQLAVYGIQQYLDHLCLHSKLEFISFATFSSTYEKRCSFTRDYEVIKNELRNVDVQDKTCLDVAFKGVNQTVLEEWGNNTATQILLVTDGNTGVSSGSLKDVLNKYHQGVATFPLPFSFPAKLHVVCISPLNEASVLRSKPMYQKLIDIVGNDGNYLVTDVNSANVLKMFQKLADDMFTSFKGILKCGCLECSILLSPVPIPYTKQTDFERKTFTVSNQIEVCGFINVADIGSPMGVSRHLILPASNTNNMENRDKDVMEIDLEQDPNEDDKTPSFCVLFHGALKVENMAALVTVAEDWYGLVYSWADSKKKSNLMLTILQPGADSVPWLGDLGNLHCAEGIPPDMLMNFPVRSLEKRSYSQTSTVWIRHAGLQSDIQKILRHAKKLPEKTQQFYKELNRLRKAAVQLGFLELLTGLAKIFEQECAQLPPNSHPDCALQLAHAADALKKTSIRDAKLIMPMQTNMGN